MALRRSLRSARHADHSPPEPSSPRVEPFTVPVHHSLHAALHARDSPSAEVPAPPVEPFVYPVHHSLHAARKAHVKVGEQQDGGAPPADTPGGAAKEAGAGRADRTA